MAPVVGCLILSHTASWRSWCSLQGRSGATTEKMPHFNTKVHSSNDVFFPTRHTCFNPPPPPSFTQFCLPLMLEKVSSDLLSAKLESLLAIAAGCPLFDLQLLHTHLQPLWTAIQREVLSHFVVCFCVWSRFCCVCMYVFWVVNFL